MPVPAEVMQVPLSGLPSVTGVKPMNFVFVFPSRVRVQPAGLRRDHVADHGLERDLRHDAGAKSC